MALALAVTTATVADLLQQKDWRACVDLATKACADSEQAPAQKAFFHFALCRSLTKLERYSEALPPGQRAVFQAQKAKDYELLGRSILEVAWVQHKIPGMELSAPITQQRFFEFYLHYKDLKNSYVMALFNLGVYFRASGSYIDALQQFRTAYQDARRRGELPLAHLARSSAVWEALRLGRNAEANALIQQGEVDRAVAADPDSDAELAIVAPVLVKVLAEQGNRTDMAAQVSGVIHNLSLRYPKAVERLLATLDERG